MSKTTIIYKDTAPGAERNSSISVSGAADFSEPSILPLLPPDELPFPEPVLTLEPNHWLLDGSFTFLAGQRIAFWSAAISGADGYFAELPIITITFPVQYTSVGLTLHFDRASGGYCSEVAIQWLQGNTEKASAVFYPDSTSYFCHQEAVGYNKIIITLRRTSLPHCYAKLEQIIFGIIRTFGMRELRGASIVNETNLISEEVPVSIMRFTLDSRDDVDFIFQFKQRMEAYNDSNLLGAYYIDKFSRKSASIYDIECYDAIGVLGDSTFPGGVYSGKSAKALLEEIVGADFFVEYGPGVTDTTLTGILQPSTRRAALQQVLFAWGVCCTTDGGYSLNVLKLPETAESIGPERTYAGVSVDTSSIVTKVIVVAHTYTQDDTGEVEVNGVKYKDAKTTYTVTNPDVTVNDKANVVEINTATLISPAIGQQTAQRVYDYYARRNVGNAKIVWQGEHLADLVSVPNAYGGSLTGHMEKMEIKLSNTVAAACAVREVT